MKANYQDKIPKQSSEIALGNLYDMNKQMMQNEPVFSAEQLSQKIAILSDWFQYSHPEEKYYMMLCHEKRDYTLFNLDKTGSWKNMPQSHCSIVAKDVIECLANRGDILGADLQDDGAWEFWIKDFCDECCAYYLFPYSKAVLEY